MIAEQQPGLPDDVQQLVVACYAIQADRAWRRGGRPIDAPQLRTITDDMMLRSQELPTPEERPDPPDHPGHHLHRPATATIAVTVQDSGKATGAVKVTPARQSYRTSCSIAVPAGEKVTLTPNPATGSTFAWTAGLCIGTGPCTLTITGVTTLTGRFSA